MSTLSTNAMRKRIIDAYGGYPQWKTKVAAMSDQQVYAFWCSLSKKLEKGAQHVNIHRKRLQK